MNISGLVSYGEHHGHPQGSSGGSNQQGMMAPSMDGSVQMQYPPRMGAMNMQQGMGNAPGNMQHNLQPGQPGGYMSYDSIPMYHQPMIPQYANYQQTPPPPQMNRDFVSQRLPVPPPNRQTYTQSPLQQGPIGHPPGPPTPVANAAAIQSMRSPMHTPVQQSPIQHSPMPPQQTVPATIPQTPISPEDKDNKSFSMPSGKQPKITGSIPGETYKTDVDQLMRAIQAKQTVHLASSATASPVPQGNTSGFSDGFDFQQGGGSSVDGVDIKSENGSAEGNGKDKPRKRYECMMPECNKSFFQKTHLDIHVRAHTGLKPFVCKEQGCGQRFSQLGNLRTHERRHTGEKPYECEVCGKKFAQRGNVRAHQLVHTQRKSYDCRLDNCGKLFTQLGNLKSHQNKFHVQALQQLTEKFMSVGDGEIPEEDKDLFEYFASLYKYSNRGIKGRGKDRKIANTRKTPVLDAASSTPMTSKPSATSGIKKSTSRKASSSKSKNKAARAAAAAAAITSTENVFGFMDDGEHGNGHGGVEIEMDADGEHDAEGEADMDSQSNHSDQQLTPEQQQHQQQRLMSQPQKTPIPVQGLTSGPLGGTLPSAHHQIHNITHQKPPSQQQQQHQHHQQMQPQHSVLAGSPMISPYSPHQQNNMPLHHSHQQQQQQQHSQQQQHHQLGHHQQQQLPSQQQQQHHLPHAHMTHQMQPQHHLPSQLAPHHQQQQHHHHQQVHQQQQQQQLPHLAPGPMDYASMGQRHQYF
jgi:uncharacterized Zn-finger protein